MEKEEWDLVATEFNGTSITCNTESGDYEFREEEHDGTPIATLTKKDAAIALTSGFGVSGSYYEGAMEHLLEEGYLKRDETGSFVLK